MNLIKLDDSILNQFIPSDKQIAIAISEVPIKDLDTDGKRDAFSKITNILLTSYHYLGFNIPGHTKDEQADYISSFSRSVIQEFITEFPMFTVSDIQLLIHNGIREKYGQYMGFNLITIHKFAKSYSEKRSEVLVKLRSLSESKPTAQIPTEKEWDIKMAKRITDEYNNLKLNKEIVDFGNIIYNYLVKKNVIKENDYIQFIDQAKKTLKERLNPRIQHTSSSAVLAEQIIREINIGNNDGIARLNIEAKLLSVRNFLSQFTSVEDLSHFIAANLAA